VKKSLLWIAGIAVCAGGAVQAQDLSGTWQGSLEVPPPATNIRTVIKIEKPDKGVSAGMMYRVDANDFMPAAVTAIKVDGKAVTFTISSMDVTYEGKLSGDGGQITGTWAHGPTTHPLNLTRVTNPATAWEIPPPPAPPKRMPADAKPSFEVATIKPGQPGRQGKNIGFNGRHFVAVNFDVNDLLALSYGLHTAQIIGAPAWFNTELFDVDGVPDIEGIPSSKQTNLMMQKLLADRFQLKFHHEQRELPVYVLTAPKGATKLTKNAGSPEDPSAFYFRGFGDMTVANYTMADFCIWFQGSVMDKPVVDHTGLTDRYNFNLKWTPDDSQFAQFRSAMGALPRGGTEDPNAPPSLYTAIQEQLGLKLTPMKTPVDVIVIDHVEEASAN